MELYSDRFFDMKKSKYILTVLSVIVAAQSICHLVMAGMYGTLLSFYKDTFFKLDYSLFQKLFAPSISYLVIAGVAQLLISVAYLLILWEYIEKTKKRLQILIALLITEFGMIFTIAVWMSMCWTYYNGLFKQYLNWTQQILQSLGQRWKKFHLAIISIVKLAGVESIILFLVILPIIIIQIIMFMDRNLSYVELRQKQRNEPTNDNIKVIPGN